MTLASTPRILIALIGCLLTATAAGEDSTREGRLAEIDASLRSAGEYLIGQQSHDGAWHSATYGAMSNDPALTPLVMSALFYIPQPGPRARIAFDRGADYLVRFIDCRGQMEVRAGELLYPVYTAASASRVVALVRQDPRNSRARGAWLEYLRRRQLTERLGWEPADRAYGGWGFSRGVPRKPAVGQPQGPFVESNLSATVFGLAALKSAKIPADDPAYAKALVFVKRCQNHPPNGDRADEQFDDGGFFFMPDDPVQNKAAVAGTDSLGRRRFRSYGSMTADGVRALLCCGLSGEHPRVKAARSWLVRNYSVSRNPGRFTGGRKILCEATYYYWTWSVAHAFRATGVTEVETADGPVHWAEALAEELIRRQRADGSWVNRAGEAKEDDPLVSTPWAAAALAICRGVLSSQCPTIGR